MFAIRCISLSGSTTYLLSKASDLHFKVVQVFFVITLNLSVLLPLVGKMFSVLPSFMKFLEPNCTPLFYFRVVESTTSFAKMALGRLKKRLCSQVVVIVRVSQCRVLF